jgi:hypothetical protein
MPSIAPYQVAADLSAISIQKLTRASNGALTVNGAAYSLVALLDAFDHTDDVQTENIKPVTSTRRNEVPLVTGSSLRITALRRSDAGQVLQNVKANASWCLVTYVEGTETLGPGYYTVGPLTRGVIGEGKQTITLQLLPCDPGQVQVPYSTSVAAS